MAAILSQHQDTNERAGGMMPSVFNIFATYQYITRHDSSFKARVRGFYRIIAGRHEDPFSEAELQNADPENPYLKQYLATGNHIGVYDLMTLGLPWLTEAFFRGNWIRWNWLRSTLRLLFQPVLGMLILVRAILSGIVTLLALPVLAILHTILRPRQ